METKRLTILLTIEEHTELKRRAGLAPMGTWIKAELHLDTPRFIPQYDGPKMLDLAKISEKQLSQGSVPSGGQPGNERGNAGSDHQDVPRTRAVRVARRGAGARGGSSYSGVVELADTQLPQEPDSKRASGRAESGRERASEARVAGSNPVPATKVSLDDVAEETKSRRKQDSSIEAAVASRTQHSVGCECFHCVQTYRFIEQQRKSTEKKEEPKKGKRR